MVDIIVLLARYAAYAFINPKKDGNLEGAAQRPLILLDGLTFHESSHWVRAEGIPTPQPALQQKSESLKTAGGKLTKLRSFCRSS